MRLDLEILKKFLHNNPYKLCNDLKPYYIYLEKFLYKQPYSYKSKPPYIYLKKFLYKQPYKRSYKSKPFFTILK